MGAEPQTFGQRCFKEMQQQLVQCRNWTNIQGIYHGLDH